MTWNKPTILTKLRQLHKAGKNISYNALPATMQPLLSASSYHFGSYRRAVEKAGIDYATVLRRPRWTKPLIVKLIKEAKRKGEDLNWSQVTKRRDELGKAAFASLQPRLFGRWDRALVAAGLDVDDVSRYRKWDRDSIVMELKERARDSEPLNSGAIQSIDAGLHAAAVRHFKTYDLALKAAKVDPAKIRLRRNWTRAEVLSELKNARRAGRHLSDSMARKELPALYGAAMRLFGSFTAARAAAGVKYQRGGPRRRSQ